jgi:hypothetical protein
MKKLGQAHSAWIGRDIAEETKNTAGNWQEPLMSFRYLDLKRQDIRREPLLAQAIDLGNSCRIQQHKAKITPDSFFSSHHSHWFSEWDTE